MPKLKSDKTRLASSVPPLERAAAPPLAYSVNSAAEATDISRSFLYKKIASGDLKIVKLGSRTLIRHDELVRFLESLA
jgi:excisionase family DNA binding protein